MPKLNVEALIFALAWAALALAGGFYGGLLLGALLSVGILIAVMASSSLILARTGNLALERQVRWAILAAAAVCLFLWLRA